MSSRRKSTISATFLATAMSLLPSVVSSDTVQQIQPDFRIDSLNKKTGECLFHIRRNGVEMTGRIPDDDPVEHTDNKVVVIQSGSATITMMQNSEGLTPKTYASTIQDIQIKGSDNISAYYSDAQALSKSMPITRSMRWVFDYAFDSCHGLNHT